MRSYDSKDEWDVKGAAEMQAPAWMLDVLKANPSYCSWGPHEDYMWNDKGGWSSGVFTERWSDLTLTLDDLNEVASFYFSVERDSKECKACGGSGYNPETEKIHADYYDFAGTGRRWVDNITQDEVQALVDAGRLSVWRDGRWEKPDPVWRAEDVNDLNSHDRVRRERGQKALGSAAGLGHDAINASILVRTRATRLGVYGHCPKCSGNGYVYTAPACRLALTLWVLHPRKGASRGWEIKSVEEADLPAAFAFLRGAAERNAQRFARIPSARTERGER